MLSIIFSGKKKVSFVSSSCRSRELSQDGELGLRILITLENGRSEAAVVKPLFNNLKPIFLPDQINQFNTEFSNKHPDQSSCYLKSCHLCHKILTFDKEVYMYRGDMGFCSEQCRGRQIYIDEMKEYEISSQKFLASFRQRHHGGGGGRCERRTQLTSASQENRVIFL